MQSQQVLPIEIGVQTQSQIHNRHTQNQPRGESEFDQLTTPKDSSQELEFSYNQALAQTKLDTSLDYDAEKQSLVPNLAMDMNTIDPENTSKETEKKQSNPEISVHSILVSEEIKRDLSMVTDNNLKVSNTNEVQKNPPKSENRVQPILASEEIDKTSNAPDNERRLGKLAINLSKPEVPTDPVLVNEKIGKAFNASETSDKTVLINEAVKTKPSVISASAKKEYGPKSDETSINEPALEHADIIESSENLTGSKQADKTRRETITPTAKQEIQQSANNRQAAEIPNHVKPGNFDPSKAESTGQPTLFTKPANPGLDASETESEFVQVLEKKTTSNQKPERAETQNIKLNNTSNIQVQNTNEPSNDVVKPASQRQGISFAPLLIQNTDPLVSELVQIHMEAIEAGDWELVNDELDIANIRSEGRIESIRSTAQAGQAAKFTPQTVQSLAGRIAKAVSEGSSRIEIRLDPPELGRVDVRLELGPDNTVRAILSAERTETLSELQRTSDALKDALADSGLDLADNGLEFTLMNDDETESETEDDQNIDLEEQPIDFDFSSQSSTSQLYGFAVKKSTSISVRA